MQATHVEHILTFEIRSVAPTEHLHTYIVLAYTDIGADIELMIVVTALSITHILAVYPNERSTVEAIEVQEDILCIPTLGKSECTAIRAHRVIAHALNLVCNIGWIVVEGILHVHIERKVITFHLPTRGDINIVPR